MHLIVERRPLPQRLVAVEEVLELELEHLHGMHGAGVGRVAGRITASLSRSQAPCEVPHGHVADEPLQRLRVSQCSYGIYVRRPDAVPVDRSRPGGGRRSRGVPNNSCHWQCSAFSQTKSKATGNWFFTEYQGGLRTVARRRTRLGPGPARPALVMKGGMPLYCINGRAVLLPFLWLVAFSGHGCEPGSLKVQRVRLLASRCSTVRSHNICRGR